MNPTKLEMVRAINEIQTRLEIASKDFNNSTWWEHEKYLGGDSFDGTYQEWIDDSFDELRTLLGLGL